MLYRYYFFLEKIENGASCAFFAMGSIYHSVNNRSTAAATHMSEVTMQTNNAVDFEVNASAKTSVNAVAYNENAAAVIADIVVPNISWKKLIFIEPLKMVLNSNLYPISRITINKMLLINSVVNFQLLINCKRTIQSKIVKNVAKIGGVGLPYLPAVIKLCIFVAILSANDIKNV